MTDEIPEVYEIESPDQLRAIAEGTRQRIWQPLVERAMTVTQVGDILGIAPARVHYHVRELERVGLVRLVATRAKGGILEKYYRSVARTIVVPPHLLRSSPPDNQIALVGDLLHGITTEALASVQHAAAAAEGTGRFTLARTQIWTTDEEWKALLAAVESLVEKYAARRGIPGEIESNCVFLRFPAGPSGPADTE
ncbi:MAG TPA: helix-turn-helix domain-containing protein [Chloroflexota bacterium]|nr:helix-turn-helix domain-containing protein [Chloroflexota bacterium]